MELRKELLEIEEMIGSTAYTDLLPSEQENLQVLRRDLKARIRQLEDLSNLAAAAPVPDSRHVVAAGGQEETGVA